MKTILFLIASLPFMGSAQESVEKKTSEEEVFNNIIVCNDTEDVYDSISKYYDFDEEAQFPGGTSALRNYILENLKFPEYLYDWGISVRCYLKFTVLSTGKISNIVVMRGVTDCPECDKEAIRLVKNMPDWIPGKVNGKPVNSIYNLPISFHPR